MDLLVCQIKANTEDDTLASENLLVYEDRGRFKISHQTIFSTPFVNDFCFHFVDSSDDEGLDNSAGESSDEWEEDESEAENGDENMDASDADE